jgi:hypothetical protein
MSAASPSLGSLTQTARKKQLRSARAILFFVGITTVGLNVFDFAMIEPQIDKAFDAEIQKLHQQGRVITDPAQLTRARATAIHLAQVIDGTAIGIGVVFVILGMIVYRYPVPVTVGALVLYIGCAAVFGYINPMILVQGVIIKVLIVIALVKALQSAVAYQREQTRISALPTAIA